MGGEGAAGAPIVSLLGGVLGRVNLLGPTGPAQACGQAAVAALGSSFALKRSSLDRSTEGVDAPTSLLRLGIDNMVDLQTASMTARGCWLHLVPQTSESGPG